MSAVVLYQVLESFWSIAGRQLSALHKILKGGRGSLSSPLFSPQYTFLATTIPGGAHPTSKTDT